MNSCQHRMDKLAEDLRAVQKRNCELCLSYGY